MRQTASESLHALVHERQLPLIAERVFRALKDGKPRDAIYTVRKVKTLAAKLGVSERHVQRGIRALEKHGFVLTVANHVQRIDPKFGAFTTQGRQLSNAYRLVLDPAERPAVAAKNAAQRHAGHVTPRVTNHVTPHKSFPQRKETEKPLPLVSPQNAASGQGEKRTDRRRGRSAKAFKPPSDASQALAWLHAFEKQRRPPGTLRRLRPHDVQAVVDLVQAHGVCEFKAGWELWVRPGRWWSPTATKTDFSPSALDNVWEQVRVDPVFWPTVKRHQRELIQTSVGVRELIIGVADKLRPPDDG